MQDTLTIGTAVLLGLAASGHCALMCGGIAGALSVAVPRDTPRARRALILATYQAGRIGSYALAGATIGGVGWALMPMFDMPAVRIGLRIATALVMAAIGLALLGRGREPGVRIGARAWQRIAPVARRFMPVRTLGSAFAFGAIWGWMPCGFVYSVLLLAWLAFDPLQSALVMLAFGAGTLPGVVAAHVGAPWLLRRFGAARARFATGVVMLVFAGATIAAPIVMHGTAHVHAPWHLDCHAS